jgi:Cdc25 family phosphatase
MSVEDLPYIQADALATLLRAQEATPAPQRRLVVIDVRGDDFAGGHIAQATNIPAPVFLEDVSSYAKQYADKEKVVFHCVSSRNRARRCAGRFRDAYAALDEATAATPEILVLEGGFVNFARLYKDDKELVADYEEPRVGA